MIAILIVEDEPEVREAIARDLEGFERVFRIEVAGDVPDARMAMEEVTAAGDEIGLVLCDHLLPGRRGTDFLVELNTDPVTRHIKKVLITGQAGHDDTIRAINEADLDHYVAKPWSPGDLVEVVRAELTDYVVDIGVDPLRYLEVLDAARLLEVVAERGDR